MIFLFTSYDNWQPTRDIIVKTLRDCCDILKIQRIFGFRMEYVDEFIFPREGFKLSEYFSFEPNLPSSFSLDFADFHLGIKLQTTEHARLILRLRGIQPSRDDVFQFLLESLLIDLPEFENCEEETLNKRLGSAHALLIDNFKKCLNIDYYKTLEGGR